MIDVVVGMQFGSEGKGKVIAALAGKTKYHGAVRVGAPNAGHTVVLNGKEYKMRHIPCAWVNPDCFLYIGAGGMVNLEVLREELAMLPSDVANRLMIDRNAMVVTEEDAESERSNDLQGKIGSTNEGIGVAMARKIGRQHSVRLASQFPELDEFTLGISDFRPTNRVHVAERVNRVVKMGNSVLVEGTQGFGLSLNHASTYPFCTSRDVLAASMLSDAGLSVKSCREVYGVMRTYPIRVAGNSGPMFAPELDWAEVTKRSGRPEDKQLIERTTVTKKVRRVSELDWAMLEESVLLNGITGIFITFTDYIRFTDYGVTRYKDLSSETKCFIADVQRKLGVPVIGVSTGPKTEEMVWLLQ